MNDKEQRWAAVLALAFRQGLALMQVSASRFQIVRQDTMTPSIPCVRGRYYTALAARLAYLAATGEALPAGLVG